MNQISEQQLDTLRSRYSRNCFGEVVTMCEQLLAQAPGETRVMEILGLALSHEGHEAEALAVLERAFRLMPDNPQLCYNLAVTCQGMGADELAMLRYRSCLRAAPDHLDALWNYGELLRVNDYFEQAVACFERILASGAKYPDIHHRLAVSYGHLGRDKDAKTAFGKALSGNSSDPALTHWEYAHFLLDTGDYKKGWKHYEFRFETTAKTSVSCQPYELEQWRGESLAGKTLLMHGEQGLGDEIMFCSVAPELASEAKRIIIACQPPLVRLFAKSFPDCTVRPHSANTNPASIDESDAVDYAVAIGSLCHYRRNAIEDFSTSSGGYLRADETDRERFERLIRRLAPASTDRFRIGIMWGSNPARGVAWGARRAAKKSIPVALLDTLSRCDNVLFISLQNSDNGAEAAWAPGLDMLDFQNELLDLADTAALISNLDLVISVDTSIAHLAGAMGIPVWIPLMQMCDWRWGRDSETAPWYDSARLFRQSKQGDWNPVIESIATELADIVIKNPTGSPPRR